MFILEKISQACSDPGLAVIISIMKKFMNILWIIGPILAMIGAGIALVKLLANPEEKKYKNLFKNMIIALLLLFLIPVIVNTVMKLFDDSFEISACWNAAENIGQTGSQNSGYINPNGNRPNSNIYDDPSDYQTGEGTATNSSNNSNSTDINSSGNSYTSVKKVIFVGDSRTVGMQSSVGTAGKDDVWSCASSMGLDWMKSTGIPSIEGQITSGTALVILMGVNDLYHVDSYISYINSLVSVVSSRNAKIYFVSVNPTSRTANYLNTDIDQFNQKMKSGLSSYVRYIDTNSFLKANGFSSNDGIHYSSTTYNQIYAYIKSSL